MLLGAFISFTAKSRETKVGSAWRSVGVCGPGLARRWFCGFGSGGAFACCASVLSVVVKNFAVKVRFRLSLLAPQ